MGLGLGQLPDQGRNPGAFTYEKYKEANSTPPSLPNLVLIG